MKMKYFAIIIGIVLVSLGSSDGKLRMYYSFLNITQLIYLENYFWKMKHQQFKFVHEMIQIWEDVL